MADLAWFFRKIEVYSVLFALWLFYLYFKSRAGFMDSMRAMLFWSLILPLIAYLAIGDEIRRRAPRSR
ncbi:MAG: hypothetical protein JZD41_03790 [Thermoproteus sp.]|nr:hypothetical protein [Thermoproteus sp.]